MFQIVLFADVHGHFTVRTGKTQHVKIPRDILLGTRIISFLQWVWAILLLGCKRCVVGPRLISRRVVSGGFSPHQPRPLRGGWGWVGGGRVAFVFDPRRLAGGLECRSFVSVQVLCRTLLHHRLRRRAYFEGDVNSGSGGKALGH